MWAKWTSPDEIVSAARTASIKTAKPLTRYKLMDAAERQGAQRIDGDAAPSFDDSDLTTDQHGMLELLGNPRIRGYVTISSRVGQPQYQRVTSIVAMRMMHERCPIVWGLGLDRIILPNGDVTSAVTE